MLQELQLPLMINWKISTKSRAFKNVYVNSFPVHYLSVKTAWMTQEIFKEWFHPEFAPAVTKHLGAKNL